MVRPSHTFNFLVVVLALLVVLMLVFPKGGIRISDDLSLYFPGLQEWWDDGRSTSDAKSTALLPDMVEEDIDGFVEPDTYASNLDSMMVDSLAANYVPRPIQVDQIHQPLELPNGSYECLSTLFQSLMDPSELSKVVRIIHYGDSQIEADRISNYLRYKLQQQFGGSGPGLVPAKTAYDYKAPCAVENIGTWYRYTIFPFVDTTVKHSRYGAMAAFSRFAPMRKQQSEPVAQVVMQAPDTTISADTVAMMDTVFNSMPSILPPSREPGVMEQMYYASLKFQPATFGHANVSQIRRIRMLYGYNQRPVSVRVRDGEQVLYDDSLRAVNGYAIRSWNFADSPQELYMDFAGADSPELYGFAMDGNGGVAVDNIPLRGCSGTIFTKIDGTTLAQMYNDLNVKCIILQFGGNAVPSLQPGSTSGFKSYLASQIRYLKRLHPGVSIILIGPADMSCKVEGTDRYETYPVLPELVNALRSAAFENGCAYWDMYAAMGGWNTMPDWVNHDPAYAAPDYVHFSGTGANIMARMFYSALIARYNEYITNN